jgi:rod shape-determining protein MreC
LLLLTLQGRGAAGASEVVALATTPVLKAVAAMHRGALSVWSTYVEWKSVRAENHRLRDEVERLRLAALRVDETAQENQRLRRLLDLRERLPIATLVGEVIAREAGGWARSLTLNRGRPDGVARLSAVITPDGLVGRVVDVRQGASIVQLVTDPTSTLSAHVLRTRTPGIVEGEARGTLRLKYMAREGPPPVVGDIVVTAGLGGVFPRGVPVGRVTAIDDRGSALFHYAVLTPMVDLVRVDEVLVVRGERTEDLSGHFPAGG